MDYDVAIIGAGLSGLAAGIRLAYFDKRVCIFERHYVSGGMNSYYRRGGRDFDVGLHALTNFVPPGVRNTPLPKMLRQLRLSREAFELREQGHSEIRFPDRCLVFTNQVDDLIDSIRDAFPDQIDGFRKLIEAIRAYDDTRLDVPYESTRSVLGTFLTDPVLIDMLLCPMMYYGSATERDMPFLGYVILFKSIFLEGFARPNGGIRTMLKVITDAYSSCGGEMRLRCGVRRVDVEDDRVAALVLDNGETVTAGCVLSCAGYPETMRLCDRGGEPYEPGTPGNLSFVEAMVVTDKLPADCGLTSSILFFNDSDAFTYARPDDPVDFRSGVVCCPTNFSGCDDVEEGLVRLTLLANSEPWLQASDNTYAALKQTTFDKAVAVGERFMPDLASRMVASDMFTPRTIQRYTGRGGGAVYGAPHKYRTGTTPVSNLFVCGTDQGYLGIIGSMLSGITVANIHVLSNA